MGPLKSIELLRDAKICFLSKQHRLFNAEIILNPLCHIEDKEDV